MTRVLACLLLWSCSVTAGCSSSPTAHPSASCAHACGADCCDLDGATFDACLAFGGILVCEPQCAASSACPAAHPCCTVGIDRISQSSVLVCLDAPSGSARCN